MTESNNPEMEIESTVDATSNNETQIEDTNVEQEESQETQEEVTQETEDQEDQLEVDEEQEDDQPEVDSQEEDLVEADFDGEIYKVPSKIKDALLRQSDYTKKTQEVAEMRRSIEQQQESFQKDVQAQQQFFKEYIELGMIDRQLQEIEEDYQAPEWERILQESPAEAMRIQNEERKLQSLHQQKFNQLRQKEAESTRNQQQHLARLEMDTQEALQREIPNWTTERVSKLREFAKSRKVDENQFEQALKTDPIAVSLLHDAYMYRQLTAKTVKSKQKPISKPVKAIKATSAKASSNLPSDNDSMKDWIAKREAQIRAKNKRKY